MSEGYDEGGSSQEDEQYWAEQYWAEQHAKDDRESASPSEPRPYPDHTKLLERLKHLSFSITGNDYAFLAENPEIEEALKVYRENVIEEAAEPRRDEREALHQQAEEFLLTNYANIRGRWQFLKPILADFAETILAARASAAPLSQTALPTSRLRDAITVWAEREQPIFLKEGVTYKFDSAEAWQLACFIERYLGASQPQPSAGQTEGKP